MYVNTLKNRSIHKKYIINLVDKLITFDDQFHIVNGEKSKESSTIHAVVNNSFVILSEAGV